MARRRHRDLGGGGKNELERCHRPRTEDDRDSWRFIDKEEGGSHDLNSRVFTSIIPQYLGNAMIAKLMPGASGQIGTAAAATAKPDGYTLLFTHNF